MLDKSQALLELSDCAEARFWKLEFESLTRAEQVFVAIWSLEGEVNNGGFDQFYFNSSGDIAYYVPEALDAIGANATAQIVRKANSLFPASLPARDRNERQLQLDALSEAAMQSLSELDEIFFRCPDNLTDLLYDFVYSNREEIAGA